VRGWGRCGGVGQAPRSFDRGCDLLVCYLSRLRRVEQGADTAQYVTNSHACGIGRWKTLRGGCHDSVGCAECRCLRPPAMNQWTSIDINRHSCASPSGLSKSSVSDTLSWWSKLVGKSDVSISYVSLLILVRHGRYKRGENFSMTPKKTDEPKVGYSNKNEDPLWSQNFQKRPLRYRVGTLHARRAE
jgi:hypothetical protein